MQSNPDVHTLELSLTKTGFQYTEFFSHSYPLFVHSPFHSDFLILLSFSLAVWILSLTWMLSHLSHSLSSFFSACLSISVTAQCHVITRTNILPLALFLWQKNVAGTS